MQLHPHHILYPARRRVSIGDVYAISFKDGSSDLFLMAKTDEVWPKVHLVHLRRGQPWSQPVCVDDPYNLTDSEVLKIVDPWKFGVQHTNLGPIWYVILKGHIVGR